ncbi:MAG: hypothetical protein P8M16_06630 [Acidimicrobiales bacterium]|nr:hypothetical protein [Acidimicrobiales bacterium]
MTPGTGVLRVTYLSVDPVGSTVGSSQVLAYVLRLAERGVKVDLHSFEHDEEPQILELLSTAGVNWIPHRFGANGAIGGLGRVVRLAWHVRGAAIVHARSDMAAAATMASSVDRWIWDVRSFWADQKVATGVFSADSMQARVFRWVEKISARRSTQVITLTTSAVAELDHRYDEVVSPKATVVTTCVDRTRFVQSSPPMEGPLRVLLAGTLNRYYDVPAMIELVEVLKQRSEVEFVVASPGRTDWEAELSGVGAVRISATAEEMPGLINSCHVGLSVCREDAGVSLLAAMPTKIGEFLAVGRPVVVNQGLVDATRMIERAQAGIGMSPDMDFGVVADRIFSLVADPGTVERATSLAAEHFDLDRGIDELVRIYGELSR